MNKCYYRIVWENYPSNKTPLNEQNLNKIDVATDEMDNRVIALDTTKFDKSEAQLLIKDMTLDIQTGILTKYYYNGSAEEINTGISKLNMNLRFDREEQMLYIVNADETEDPVDLSVFITNYEFEDSDTIAHNVSSGGMVTSIVKEGSIEERHLRPDYLADIRVEAAKAEASAAVADASEKNAKKSEDAALASQAETKKSEVASAASAQSSQSSAETAAQKASDASKSAESARASKESAENFADSAENSKNVASGFATTAAESASTAGEKSDEASGYAKMAESYAVGTGGVRPNEVIDSAKYYYEQIKSISEGIVGALQPMGTVVFANLPPLDDIESGWMYNISDEFTTDSSFKEGAGNVIPAGSNVYKTADGFWDVLSGSPVTKVNGQTGNVEITAESIGLGNIISQLQNIDDHAMKKNTERLQFATFTDFWKYANDISNTTSGTFIGFKDVGKWCPTIEPWHRSWISFQNWVGNGVFDVDGSIVLLSGTREIFYGRVFGGKNGYDDLSVTWHKIIETEDGNLIISGYIECGKKAYFKEGTSVHYTESNAGTVFVKIASFEILRSYTDAPISIELSRRVMVSSCKLWILFETSKTHDPELFSFCYANADYTCYMHKATDSIWDLYVKCPSWDSVEVISFNCPTQNLVKTTWKSEFIDDIPSGAIAARLAGLVEIAERSYILGYYKIQDQLRIREHSGAPILNSGDDYTFIQQVYPDNQAGNAYLRTGINGLGSIPVESAKKSHNAEMLNGISGEGYMKKPLNKTWVKSVKITARTNSGAMAIGVFNTDMMIISTTSSMIGWTFVYWSDQLKAVRDPNNTHAATFSRQDGGNILFSLVPLYGDWEVE